MRLFIKLSCCILVLGLAGLFVLKKPDGRPWLSLNDFTSANGLIPSAEDIKQSVQKAVPDQLLGGGAADGSGHVGDNVAVYKWQDAEGNWQYSDTPPTNGTAQQVLVGTDLNRDLAPVAPSLNSSNSSGSQSGKVILLKRGSNTDQASESTPGDLQDLIKEAQNVQNLVDERQQQLDSALQ